MAHPVAAQTAGRVTGEDGRPLPATTVEIWVGTARIGRMRTDADGTFRLTSAADTLPGARAVTVRKIGFRPVSRIVERGARPLVVTLVKLPSVLSEVKVTAEHATPRDPCGLRPTAEAAALFARAASFYRDDTRWLDRIARYAHASRPSFLADRETFVGVPQRGGWTRNAGLYDGPSAGNTTAVPRALTAAERLALPFPKPERDSDWRHQIIGWIYPRFHEWGAPSFVSRSFVESMPKAVSAKNAEGFVVLFCPADRQAPYTSGEIQLAPDTTVVSVRWHFTVIKPGAETGGIAIFAAPETRVAKAHLLPTNAIVWTRLPDSGRFESTEYSYGRWLVAELGDSVRGVPPGGER